MSCIWIKVHYLTRGNEKCNVNEMSPSIVSIVFAHKCWKVSQLKWKILLIMVRFFSFSAKYTVITPRRACTRHNVNSLFLPPFPSLPLCCLGYAILQAIMERAGQNGWQVRTHKHTHSWKEAKKKRQTRKISLTHICVIRTTTHSHTHSAYT